jgi:hypothetical protein
MIYSIFIKKLNALSRVGWCNYFLLCYLKVEWEEQDDDVHVSFQSFTVLVGEVNLFWSIKQQQIFVDKSHEQQQLKQSNMKPRQLK